MDIICYMDAQPSYDLIIIGSGPNGLACAVAAQRAGLNYLILEKGGFADAIRRFPVDMRWFSTANLLEIGDVPFTSNEFHPTRQASLRYYQRVSQAYDMPIKLLTEVHNIVPNTTKGFSIQTNRGDYCCEKVIVATGYYDSPNMIGVEGEDLPHVSHYYDEASAYFGLRVAVIGGQNSAVDAALDLFRNDVDVTLIHRGESIGPSVKYWIKPDIENRIKEGSIKSYFSSVIASIDEEAIVVSHSNGSGSTRIEVDQVFILTGYRPDPALLIACGVEVDSQTLEPSCDPKSFETNIPGLYVAGSVVSGKFTNKIFIENGREHGQPIIDHIVQSRFTHVS